MIRVRVKRERSLFLPGIGGCCAVCGGYTPAAAVSVAVAVDVAVAVVVVAAVRLRSELGYHQS